MKTYFRRLVLSFLLTSLVPLVLIGMGFFLSSRRMVIRAVYTRAKDSIETTADHIGEVVDTYRHVSYVISRNPLSQEAVNGTNTWDSRNLKNIYQFMYDSLEGHIYSAAVHIFSDDGKAFFSTHSLPKRYDLRIYENHDGIFSEIRTNPEKSYIYVDPFITDRGDRVAFSLLREIPGGYIIIDVYASPLVAAEKNPYLDSILIADLDMLKAFDYYNPERDGTFDKFEELQLLSQPSHVEEYILSGNFLAVAARVPDTPLYTVGSVNLDNYMQNISVLGILGAWLLLLVILIILFISFKLSRSISGPIHSIVDAMRRTEKGEIIQVKEINRQDEIGYLVHNYNTMVGRIEELLEKTREEERALKIAERKILQSQINPHFLYNTLGTIKSMAKLKKNDEISDIVTRLGKVLRSTFKAEGVFCLLSEELEIIHNYIAIQKYRFGERLHLLFSIDEKTLDTSLPRLILQPIVENAVVHSVETSRKTIRIVIASKKDKNNITLMVSDNGPGITSADGEKTEGMGIGLSNVRRRLFLAYGEKGRLDIKSEAGHGTEVTLTIPDNRANGSSEDV
ncbi:MAG: sensor histidine kinase [Spirochaetales bacterium]|nr:sensor histidine kinase [Spirochaetales bacterium]